MHFIPIGTPSGQNATQFVYHMAEAELPWRGAWAVTQTSEHVGTIRFVPDLSVHLIFDLTGQFDVEPFLLATGTTYRDIALPPGTHLIGLHFAVWDAFPLRAPGDDTPLFQTVKLDADWVFFLYFQLLEVRNQGGSPEQTLQAILQPFQRWIDRSLQTDFRQHFFEVVSGGSDEGLAYSERHRRRLYQQQIGLAPKQVARIVRFQQALHELRTADEVSLEGYYDQAHFIREFRAFTGMTPTAYRRAYGG